MSDAEKMQNLVDAVMSLRKRLLALSSSPEDFTLLDNTYDAVLAATPTMKTPSKDI